MAETQPEENPYSSKWSQLKAKCQNFATISLVQLVVVTTLAMMDY